MIGGHGGNDHGSEDRRAGGVKIARAHREALLDAFEHAGISGKAFARHHGVNYQTFVSAPRATC